MRSWDLRAITLPGEKMPRTKRCQVDPIGALFPAGGGDPQVKRREYEVDPGLGNRYYKHPMYDRGTWRGFPLSSSDAIITAVVARCGSVSLRNVLS